MQPFSRGGGYRGGRGSLPKALLDSNVPQKIMGKIVGLALMMSYIAPSDTDVFHTAIQMLKSEFNQYLSENIIKQYLNGNPKDFGGCCAGQAGTVASNQGGERRGGWIKKGLSDILNLYCLSQTINPVYFLVAAANDADHYFPHGANGIATQPNRGKVEQHAFKSLSGLANHNANRANFSSDWLYSITTVETNDGDEAQIRTEVPLHTILGHKNKSFTVFIPSIANQCNTLRKMLVEEADYLSSGPMALMQHCPSNDQIDDITSTPLKCYKYLATIDKFTQKLYKDMIRDRLIKNTIEPKENENLSAYLRRHCHRDESKDATDRFTSEVEYTIGRQRKKGRGKKGVEEARGALLEAIKWNELDKLVPTMLPAQESNTSNPSRKESITKTFTAKPGHANKTAADISLNNNNDFMDGLRDFVDGYKLVDDDAEQEQVETLALLATTIEERDVGSVVYADVTHTDNVVKDEIRVPRELGKGTTVSICNDIVICNCEMFTRWKICRHCIYFEFLHCRTFPQGNATDGNTSYPSMRDSILSHIKNIDI